MRIGKSAHSWRSAIVAIAGMVSICVVCDNPVAIGAISGIAGGYIGMRISK